MTLLVLLLLAQADGALVPDAGHGTRWEHPLYSQCPWAPPSVVLADGQRLLTQARARRLDCLLVTADERWRQLETSPLPLLSRPSLIFAVVMAVAGFAAGAWVAALFR